MSTKTYQYGQFIVHLFRLGEDVPYHGYEVYHEKATNETGYHREGYLHIEGGALTDFDGAFELPRAVQLALTAEGINCEEA